MVSGQNPTNRKKQIWGSRSDTWGCIVGRLSRAGENRALEFFIGRQILVGGSGRCTRSRPERGAFTDTGLEAAREEQRVAHAHGIRSAQVCAKLENLEDGSSGVDKEGQ